MTFKYQEMNIRFKTILKDLTLAVLWLLISPLFLFFSIRWKRPKKIARIILTVIAPFTLIVFFIVLISGGFYYYHYIQRGSRAEIERRTGIEFPWFKTVERRKFEIKPLFTGDFSMKRKVRIDTAYIKGIIGGIDNSTKDSLSRYAFNYIWDINGNVVSFNYMDENDILKFSIDRETGVMDIDFGRY